MAQTIKIEPEKWIPAITEYFSHLATDMIIAWSVLGVGVILVVVGIIMM